MGVPNKTSPTPCAVSNVANLLMHHVALMGATTKSPGGAMFVDGVPFWTAVAKAAVALGATAEPLVLYGPVQSPPAGQKPPNA